MLTLITRPEPYATRLSHTLKKAGFSTRLLPTIVTEPVFFSIPPFEAYQAIIFLSQAAVRYFFEKGDLKNYRGLLFAIGKSTADLLTEQSGRSVKRPALQNSEGLLALSSLQKIKGQHLLIVSGKNSRPLLAQTLKARGAHVSELEVYARTLPSLDLSSLREDWPMIHCLITSSAENLNNLVTLLFPIFQERLYEKTLIVISESMVNLARSLGFTRILRATDARDETILGVLREEQKNAEH